MTTDNLQTLAAWLNENPNRWVIMRGGRKVAEGPTGEYRYDPDGTRLRFEVRDGHHAVETQVSVEICCDIMAGDLSDLVVHETKMAIECLVFSTKRKENRP